jgi:hypothetical protein
VLLAALDLEFRLCVCVCVCVCVCIKAFIMAKYLESLIAERSERVDYFLIQKKLRGSERLLVFKLRKYNVTLKKFIFYSNWNFLAWQPF